MPSPENIQKAENIINWLKIYLSGQNVVVYSPSVDQYIPLENTSWLNSRFDFGKTVTSLVTVYVKEKIGIVGYTFNLDTRDGKSDYNHYIETLKRADIPYHVSRISFENNSVENVAVPGCRL